jgi:hypothetical protein
VNLDDVAILQDPGPVHLLALESSMPPKPGELHGVGQVARRSAFSYSGVALAGMGSRVWNRLRFHGPDDAALPGFGSRKPECS